MALPISSQGYIPNPLLIPQAQQMGLDYGQDIIGGMIQAAQGTANVVSTIQDIQMKPEKFELEKQRVAADMQAELARTRIAESNLQIAQDREIRMGEQFQLQQDLRQDQFKLREQESDYKIRNYESQIKSRNLNDAVKISKLKETQLFDNVTSEYYDNGNVDAITGYMGDNSTPAGRSRQSKFVNYLTDEKNAAVSTEIIQRMKSDIASENVTPQQKEVLERTIEAVNYKNDFKAQAKLADKYNQVFNDDIGVIPTKGMKLIPKVVKNATGGEDIEVYETDPGGKNTRYLGRRIGDGDPDKLNKFYNAIDSRNAMIDVVDRRVQKTREKYQSRSLPPNEERPAKEVPQRTPTQRTGNLPPPDEQRRAVQQTEREVRQRSVPSSQKIAARNRRLRALGLTPRQDVPQDGKERAMTRDSLSAFNPREEQIVIGR